MRTMKIGFLTTSLSSDDGWGRYSKSLIEAVAAHAEVVVLTTKDAQNISKLKDVHAVLPSISFHPRAQWALAKQCLAHLQGCDIVHSLVEPYAPGAAYAAKKIGAHFTMTLHGTYSAPPKSLFSVHRWMLAYALKRATLTTTGSPRTEACAREVISFGECRFIPNGVETEQFHTIPGSVHRPFLLTTGAVKPRKGADIVVRALGLIKDAFPQLTYTIVGDLGHTAFVAELKKIAASLDIADRIEFKGIVSDEQLRTFYNECMIFILASRSAGGQFEGFPMVYFEANACGAPVITTKGYGSEYAIKDGVNGFLVPEEDPKAIADAVRKILTDDGLRKRMTAEALKVAALHRWERIAKEQLVPFYKDIVQK